MIALNSFSSIVWNSASVSLPSADLFNVVDEKPRQVEQPRHPGDHRHHMEGLHPRIHVRKKVAHWSGLRCFFLLLSRKES